MSEPGEPRRFRSAEEAAEAFFGEKLAEREIGESRWYDDLRDRLRTMRSIAGLSQAAVAERLEIGQSEVSRLETSLGPGTRLGRIRAYLATCDASLSFSIEPAAMPAAAPLPGGAFTGTLWLDPATGQLTPTPVTPAQRAQSGFGDPVDLTTAFLLALDEAMGEAGLPAETAGQIRRTVLHRVHRHRGPGVAAGPLEPGIPRALFQER
jgi:transcriptional regulator with XRE-family HTH domain